MFSFIKKIASQVKTKTLAVATSASALALSALTVVDGQVTFGTSDNTIMSQAVANAIGNLWNGFLFILPYVGIAVGVILVMALGKKLLRTR